MNPTDLETLKENALETAQRLIDYDSYGGRRTKAIAALRRRTPGHENSVYEYWFDEAVQTHKCAISYTRKNADFFYKLMGINPNKVSFAGHIDEFENENPKFSARQLDGVLVFTFYLYHLR